jgi:hypothetical protein
MIALEPVHDLLNAESRAGHFPDRAQPGDFREAVER